MSWLLPSALAIAGLASLVAVALHFIARSRPLAEPLPTARFIPQRPVQARTRSYALSDLPLLLIRLAALLALGAAVAGPVFAAARGRVARVVLVDRSRAVAAGGEARDSAVALLRAGDELIAFDSSAAAPASVDSLAPRDIRGSLSTGLAAAIRAAATLAERADSVELIVVSPFAAEEMDSATSRIRDAWKGRVRAVMIRVSSAGEKPFRLTTDATSDDPIVAGLSLAGAIGGGDGRLVRGRLTAADSAWVRAAHRLLLHWPATDTAALWQHRDSIDAIGGVVSGTGTLVSRFPRIWTLKGEAVARWTDGEPAAVEHREGSGCIRDVAMLLDPSSDITLRLPFRQFTEALLAPCGGHRDMRTMDRAWMDRFTRGGSALASAASSRDSSEESSRWTPWLLSAVALLLLAEVLARRSERSVAA